MHILGLGIMTHNVLLPIGQNVLDCLSVITQNSILEATGQFST